MYSSQYVKYALFLSYFNDTWILLKFFEESSSSKFHENPSSGSRVVPREQTDGRTEMAKVIVAFRNFAKAPEKSYWNL
jgi:hypothetical protein